MLRIIENSSAAGAKSYYTSASLADYYTEGQELTGEWGGKGAARLGLSGPVGKEAWDRLCDNLHPATGETLTARQKDPRRIGYDFNFHATKSLSLLYCLTRDERLLDAFRQSVDETMAEMEAEMQTRVRTNGRNEDRTTGNFVYGQFTHFTSRPVGGVPDPHLHSHVFCFNTTWDEAEGRWKAGQFGQLKREASYYEAVFQSKLSERIADLGLSVDRTKTAWEISGLDKPTLAKFSRRTALIEQAAHDQGITSPSAKAELGAKTREKKQKNLSMEQLRTEWRSRLTREELTTLGQIQKGIGCEPAVGRAAEQSLAANEAARLAKEHCLERSSVVPERTLLREALRRSYGKASRAAVERAALGGGVIRAVHQGINLVTTAAVLAEESAVVKFARDGRGTCPALGQENRAFTRDWLSGEQKRAVRHILGSSDRVILLRGRAGVGKTTLMSEAIEACEANGQKVFTFAPSASASRGVLREEGFETADTVARLLADQKLQETVRGHVIWIDEAGLLGVRTMKQVFDLAEKIDARVILAGDERQHGPVEAGAALKLLESDAGLVPAELVQIRRQKGAYLQAVTALSEGRVADGFRQLDQMGAIKEVPRAERYKALAREYVESRLAGKKTLVISPTHVEAGWVSDEIRSSLRQSGTLGTEQRIFQTLENANLTAAERADAVNLSPDDVLVYHQNAKGGHKKGDRVVIGEAAVRLEQADRFTVYHPSILPLSPGDAIRLTKNGQTLDGKRVNNGDIFTVRGFSDTGDIELTNGSSLAKDYGHISHGYVITSHASQGRTVDKVIVAESASSFGAASPEQLYVSVSRGRREVTIYTDDRQALLQAVSQHGQRLTATEFVAERESRARVLGVDYLAGGRVPSPSDREPRQGLDHER
jgi:conjugative relaxase-like TrwC/TraI family protein